MQLHIDVTKSLRWLHDLLLTRCSPTHYPRTICSRCGVALERTRDRRKNVALRRHDWSRP